MKRIIITVARWRKVMWQSQSQSIRLFVRLSAGLYSTAQSLHKISSKSVHNFLSNFLNPASRNRLTLRRFASADVMKMVLTTTIRRRWPSDVGRNDVQNTVLNLSPNARRKTETSFTDSLSYSIWLHRRVAITAMYLVSSYETRSTLVVPQQNF